jgi:hypothetical protein
MVLLRTQRGIASECQGYSQEQQRGLVQRWATIQSLLCPPS